MSVDLGAARAPLPCIGIVAPFDLELDREYWRFVDEDTSVLITRTGYVDGPVGVGLAEAVSDLDEVAHATRSLIAARPGVVAYACTSGSFTGGLAGEARLREAIVGAGAPAAITTSGAILEAFAALGLRTVAIGTPYTDDLAARLGVFVVEAGYEPVSLVSMGLEGDIAHVQRQRVIELATTADRPDADAVFLACTNLPTFDLVPELESRLGKPLLNANQVTMWSALRAIGAPAGPAVPRQALFERAPTSS
jgi:maleate isomerase